MAFWKIYTKPKGQTFNSKQEIGLVDGERAVVNFLRALPDVGSVRDSKGYGYTTWITFSKDTYKFNGEYIAMQYKPTEKEIAILRPKKKYVAPKKRTIGIKKGDIFGTSWGYDQTQYNFVIVTEVSPTGKTVKVKNGYDTMIGYWTKFEPVTLNKDYIKYKDKHEKHAEVKMISKIGDMLKGAGFGDDNVMIQGGNVKKKAN